MNSIDVLDTAVNVTFVGKFMAPGDGVKNGRL